MLRIDRRGFFGTALGGAAAMAGVRLLGQEPATVGSDLGRPDTLFLTWQRDPTTTMTVQWLGDESDPADVSFAVHGPGAVWRTVVARSHSYPFTDLHVFRVELTGLTPGTEYQFQLGGTTAVPRFRTMPARATDTFSFVSGGDCGVNEHAVATNVLAARQDPMFALIGGDLGYDNGRSVENSLGFVRNYSRHMVDGQGRLVPMVVCIGNHEVAGGYGKARRDAPFYFALHDGLYAERSYATLDFGDYLSLVLLDTGHVTPIGGEQTDWLDQALAERTERPHLIVANHVPAYPSLRKFETEGGRTGTGAENREHWVPLFEHHNVDVVLEHHDHTFKRTRPLKRGVMDAQGITYLGDGSWGKLRHPEPAAMRPYLAVSNASYHMSLHRLEGDQRFHLALEESGRVVDVYATRKRPRRAPGRGA